MTLPPTLPDREYQKFEEVDGEVTVRVTGSNFSGDFQVSGLQIAGKITEVTIDNTSWTALPATPLANRNALCIQNRSGQEIKINYDNSVMTYTGMVVPNNGERQYDVQNIVIYAKSSTSSCVVTVEELS